VAGNAAQHGHLVQRFPETGECCSSASGLLHHPPVSQPFKHFGASAGSVGRTMPDFDGADVGSSVASSDSPGRAAAFSSARPASAIVGWRAERYNERIARPISGPWAAAIGVAMSIGMPSAAIWAARSCTSPPSMAPPGHCGRPVRRSTRGRRASPRPCSRSTSSASICECGDLLLAAQASRAEQRLEVTHQRRRGCHPQRLVQLERRDPVPTDEPQMHL
jgi:hypothetical protein